MGLPCLWVSQVILVQPEINVFGAEIKGKKVKHIKPRKPIRKATAMFILHYFKKDKLLFTLKPHYYS